MLGCGDVKGGYVLACKTVRWCCNRRLSRVSRVSQPSLFSRLVLPK